MSPLPPDILPASLRRRYDPLGVLGEGGFGVVVRALDRELDRQVAIKVVRGGLGGPNGVARFRREATQTSALSHPHVVPVLDFGLTDGEAYIVYGLLEGVDAESLLERSGPIEPERVRRWGVALAGALAAAHEVGVIHRDLKPSNVVIVSGDRPVLCDFGIARVEGDARLTATGMLVGTPAYMAPELWRGEPASPASDQYALALMLSQLATGEAPRVQAADARGVTPACAPDALQAHAPELGGPLARALAADPRDRFPDLAALGAALERGMTPLAPSRPNVAPSVDPRLAATRQITTAPAAQPTTSSLPRVTPAAGPRRRGPVLALVVAGGLAALAAFGVRSPPAPPGSPPPAPEVRQPAARASSDPGVQAALENLEQATLRVLELHGPRRPEAELRDPAYSWRRHLMGFLETMRSEEFLEEWRRILEATGDFLRVLRRWDYDHEGPSRALEDPTVADAFRSSVLATFVHLLRDIDGVDIQAAIDAKTALFAGEFFAAQQELAGVDIGQSEAVQRVFDLAQNWPGSPPPEVTALEAALLGMRDRVVARELLHTLPERDLGAPGSPRSRWPVHAIATGVMAVGSSTTFPCRERQPVLERLWRRVLASAPPHPENLCVMITEQVALARLCGLDAVGPAALGHVDEALATLEEGRSWDALRAALATLDQAKADFADVYLAPQPEVEARHAAVAEALGPR